MEHPPHPEERARRQVYAACASLAALRASRRMGGHGRASHHEGTARPAGAVAPEGGGTGRTKQRARSLFRSGMVARAPGDLLPRHMGRKIEPGDPGRAKVLVPFMTFSPGPSRCCVIVRNEPGDV